MPSDNRTFEMYERQHGQRIPQMFIRLLLVIVFETSPTSSNFAALPGEFFGPIGRGLGRNHPSQPSSSSTQLHPIRHHHSHHPPHPIEEEKKLQCGAPDADALSPAVQRALAEMMLPKDMEEGGGEEEPLLPPAMVPVREEEEHRDRARQKQRRHQNPFLEMELHDSCLRPEEDAEPEPEPGSAFGDIQPGMPLEMRSLCNFVAVDNIDERRLPRRLPEVQCLCDRPNRGAGKGSGGLRCEPLQYDVPVLLFDAECKQFKQVQQRITLACVAVYPTTARTQFRGQMGRARGHADGDRALRRRRRR